jgi:quercetin dioxygenase-like cupin family protein
VNAEQFAADLRARGFSELVTVVRDANGMLGEHSHPFESRALILAGEITLRVARRDTCYRAGDVFQLGHAEIHEERYGPQGVSYLVGRK